MSNLWIS